MIVYTVEKILDSHNNNVEYKILEYFVRNNTIRDATDTTGSDVNGMTGTDVKDMMTGCIHTATLAVCTVLVVFVLFLGCTGNGVVLFNALTTKRQKNNFDLLSINLAGADFIMCTCLSPMFLFLLYSESDIPTAFCGSILFLGILSSLLSLLSIVVIAVHRKCRVTGSLRKTLSLLKVSAIVGFIWLISTCIALAGTIHVTASWHERSVNDCQIAVNNSDLKTNNFVLYYMSPIIMVSLVTISVCYGVIARSAKGQTSYRRSVVPLRAIDYLNDGICEDTTDANTNCVTITADKCVPSGVDARSDNGSKATTMCLVVTLTVMLCWVPLLASQFIQIVAGESIILYQVKVCGIALIFLNSALNPYLYGQSNSKVKHKYIQILYNFARCEYTFPVGNTARQFDGIDTFEKCPLQASQALRDTHSGLSCLECESQCQTFEESPCGRRYLNNIQYGHNMLLLTRQDNAVVSNIDHAVK